MSLDRTSIETYSGVLLDYANPHPEDILLDDIAYQLANTCRFRASTTQWYSVAEHAIRVAELVPDELKLAALHHDSHEAYTGDIPTPLKNLLGYTIKDIQSRLDFAIGEAFGIDPNDFHHPLVKAADLEMLAREGVTFKRSYWRDRCPDAHVLSNDAGWFPPRAWAEFVAGHQTLVRLDSLEVCPTKAATHTH